MTVPEPASDAPSPAPSATPAPTASAEPQPDSRPWRAGAEVVARGKLSKVPWQHLMSSVPGKKSEYFDLEDGSQTVIYVKDAPDCSGFLRVEATVLSVRGASKRPGRETKVDDSYEELQLDVKTARCDD